MGIHTNLIAGKQVQMKDVTPSKHIFAGIVGRGYSLPQAISELVDNSIDAGATKVKILVSDGRICVEDNGIGMGEDALVDAMTLGHSDKKDQLGVFGLGMKSACGSLGSGYSIEAKAVGDVIKYEIKIDNKWLSDPSWKLPLYQTNSQNPKTSFTKISITPKNKKHNIRYLENELGKTYMLYGDNPAREDRGTRLYLNGKKIKTRDYIPEFKELSNGVIQTKYGEYSYCIGKLGKPSFADCGVSIFRHGRTICYARKMGFFTYNPYLNSFCMFVSGNFFPVTSDKRDFERESPIWKEVEKTLMPMIEREIKRITRESNLKPEKIPGSVIDKIIDQTAKILKKVFPKRANVVGAGNIEVEVIDIPTKKRNVTKKRNKSDKPRRNLNIIVGGKNYKFNLKPIKDKGAPVVCFSEKNGVVDVIVNQASKTFKTTDDKILYSAMFYYEGISRFISQRGSELKTETIRDKLVKEVRLR